MGARTTLFLFSFILIFVECGYADAPRENKLGEKDVIALVSQLLTTCRKTMQSGFYSATG